MSTNDTIVQKTKRIGRRIGPVGIWLLLCVGVAALAFLVPFRYGVVRLALALGTVAIWGGALILAWRQPVLRGVLAVAALAPLVLLLLPDRPADPEPLRAAYLRSLRSYLGTVYVWGGETRTGIDCSGLMRRAMIDAELSEGMRTGNAGLLRAAARLWWYDCSARAMRAEYRGFTKSLMSAKSINEADYSQLLPGDMAVTAGGSHILAYLGDRTWIQADPKPWKVVTNTVPTNDGWFIQDAQFIRWSILSDRSKNP